MDILKLSTDIQSGLIRALNFEPTVTDMLTMIVDRAATELGASACTIFIVDPEGETATQRAGTGYQWQFVDKVQCRVVPADQVPDNPEKDVRLGLTGWILSTGKSFLAQTPEELSQHPHRSGKHDPKQLPGEKLRLQTFLGVPLRSLRGEIVGLIKAERRTETDKPIEPFSVSDQIVLETVARVASKCLVYLDIARAGNTDSAITAWTRDVISEAAATEGELDSFLYIVVNVMAAAMQADSCGVYLIDEGKKTLTQRAGIGSQAPRHVIRSYQLPKRGEVKVSKEPVGLTSWIAATGQPFYARNFGELSAHPHHRGEFDPWNFPEDTSTICGAFLGVPLQVGGTTIGVLKVENISKIGIPDSRDFCEEARRRFDILAQDIALAILRLRGQSGARYQVIVDAQPTIFEILRGGLDVPDLVHKVVTEVAKLFNARACALFLKEGNRLIQPPWAAYGWFLRGPEVREYKLVEPEAIKDDPTPDEKVGLTVWIAAKQEKFTARSNLELTMHPHHRGTFDKHNFDPGQRCESFMGVPLTVEDKLVGVLKVETKMKPLRPGVEEFTYFSGQDELVFELIAKSAAIAIQNARLLESRRLADRVLARPNTDQVMMELYDFIQGRVEVMSTLDSTIEQVQSKDPRKASIIQGFAGLLKPSFHIAILQQLAKPMKGTLKSFLGFLAIAIRTGSLDEIRALQDEQPTVAALLNTKFFLHDCAEVFLDTLNAISDQLELYEQDHTYRDALQRSIELLKETEIQLAKMNPFERSVLGRACAHWRQVIEEELERFHNIPNPYVAGVPLGPDSPVFVGREEIFRWIEANLYNEGQKNGLVLHGGWHTGKTSILYQLQAGPLGQHMRERQKHPIFPVFIDLQGMPDPGTDLFLVGVAESVESALRERGLASPYPTESDFRKAPYRAFDTFLKEVEQLLAQSAQGLLVIMLDEFELLDDRVKTGKIDAEIFRYLRSKMQHHPLVTFILAGRHRLDEMTLDYRNLLFNVALHKEVGFLNVQESEFLIRNPVKTSAVTYKDRVVERILNLTGGHPFFIQQLCYSCIDLLNRQRRGYEVKEDHLDCALKETLAHNAVLENLWEREVNEYDKQVLKALAELPNGEQTWVALSELRKNAGLEESQISESLKRLETQRLIVRSRSLDQGQEVYRYGIDLLRLWVMRRLS